MELIISLVFKRPYCSCATILLGFDITAKKEKHLINNLLISFLRFFENVMSDTQQ